MQKVLFTIIHSCDDPSPETMQAIRKLYNGFGYVARWAPGEKLTEGAVHFTAFKPSKDRNGIEKWENHNIRFVSWTTALIELRTDATWVN